MGVSDHGRLGDHSRRPQRMGGTVSIVVEEYWGSIATLLGEASGGGWRRLRGSASTSSVWSLGTRSGPPGLAAGEGGSCWPGISIGGAGTSSQRRESPLGGTTEGVSPATSRRHRQTSPEARPLGIPESARGRSYGSLCGAPGHLLHCQTRSASQ